MELQILAKGPQQNHPEQCFDGYVMFLEQLVQTVVGGFSITISGGAYQLSQVVAAMCSTIPLLSNSIMKATKCNSFNLLVNSGAAAGQVVYHTHLHIIPRKENDCLWNSESSRRKPLKLSQETVNLANHIREQLSFTKRSVNIGDHKSKQDENS